MVGQSSEEENVSVHTQGGQGDYHGHNHTHPPNQRCPLAYRYEPTTYLLYNFELFTRLSRRVMFCGLVDFGDWCRSLRHPAPK